MVENKSRSYILPVTTCNTVDQYTTIFGIKKSELVDVSLNLMFGMVEILAQSQNTNQKTAIRSILSAIPKKEREIIPEIKFSFSKQLSDLISKGEFSMPFDLTDNRDEENKQQTDEKIGDAA